ncbi:hypothetical protein AB6A40_001108 [Gnathostoma spinigerum]|uniref:Uncharacterized protein n=1 Tax=Gnathostoma spinigerum TaxID=75299 RepID=A0ABD6E3F2_9BILA
MEEDSKRFDKLTLENGTRRGVTFHELRNGHDFKVKGHLTTITASASLRWHISGDERYKYSYGRVSFGRNAG